MGWGVGWEGAGEVKRVSHRRRYMYGATERNEGCTCRRYTYMHVYIYTS